MKTSLGETPGAEGPVRREGDRSREAPLRRTSREGTKYTTITYYYLH